MDQQHGANLFELADRILAVGRLIHASKGVGADTWTPLESAVMRVIDREPGILAGAAAEATQLISSNFSRALRSLESKGLVRRETDRHDARRIHLYPTERAQEHLAELHDVWSRLLDGIVSDPGEIDVVISVLRHIEVELAARARRAVQ